MAAGRAVVEASLSEPCETAALIAAVSVRADAIRAVR